MSQPAMNGEAAAAEPESNSGLSDAAIEQTAMLGAEQAQHGDPLVRGEVLKQLTETDLSALTEAQQEILQNLVTRDWVLGYLSKAESWEMKVGLLILKEQFYNMFPKPRSPLQGAVRAYVANDETQRLQALTQRAKYQTETFFSGVKMRLTRSEEGQLLERIDRTITETHVEDRSGDDERTGLLGRMKR